MDAEMAIRKDELQKHKQQVKDKLLKRQQQIKDELSKRQQQKQQTSMENINKSNDAVDLINIELQTLRMEFELEELNNPKQSFTEVMDKNLEEYCCCGIFPIYYLFRYQSQSSVKSLLPYFKVKMAKDIINAHQQLQKRVESILYCYIDCFHRLGCQTKKLFCCDYCRCNSKLILAILFGIGAVFMFPMILTYGCFRVILNKCYRPHTRFGKILKVYNKYKEMIEE